MKVSLEASPKQLSYLLCSGMEGGVNYWAMLTDKKEPTEYVHRFDEKRVYSHIDYPMNPGGHIELTDTQDPNKATFKLDSATLQKGLQIMAEKYPQHYADFMNENDDAITGDVFIQCCVFGEVIYG